MSAERFCSMCGAPVPHSQAAIDILAERRRQIESEGWTPEHDDQHGFGQLALAASCYALDTVESTTGVFNEYAKTLWPWGPRWWKPSDRRRNLVKAGALILAEIDRIDRLSQKENPS